MKLFFLRGNKSQAASCAITKEGKALDGGSTPECLNPAAGDNDTISESGSDAPSVLSFDNNLEGAKTAKKSQELANRLKTAKIYKITLDPIDCSFNTIRDLEGQRARLQPTTLHLQRKMHSKATIVFCIRRPGCGSCRDHARQLVSLAERPEFARKVNMFGITKHGQGVDDDALLDFYQQYFGRHPIYKDDKWRIFHAMGGRTISIPKLLRTFPKMNKRYNELGIENIPFGGDIQTQGGVMIFDRDGTLRYTYYENYGDRLDLSLLSKALKKAIEPRRSSTSTSSN